MRKREWAILAAALAVAGCFNEPEPAYKTVPAENRIYLSDKNLTLLPELNPKADYLNLDRNSLTNVDKVSSMVSLKWLRLNDNKLAALPDLSKLVSLRRIYLKNNRFAAVPETLGSLPALTDIDLSGNPIKEVPAWLAKKEGLKNLSFSRTRIEKLPDDISAWKSLSSLQLGELNFSAAEMKRIREALPAVAIVF
jgi:Leucine-rich repeat (LRR) protein